MKRLILLLALLTFFVCGQAQDELENSFKPQKNNFSIEVDFTPFNFDKPIELNSFRGRFFLSDKIALRTGFNFDNKKNYYETPANTPDDIMLFNENEEKYNVLGINTGLEFHILNSKRISPYVGFDLSFENKSSNASYTEYFVDFGYPYNEYDVTQQKTEVTNAWEGEVNYYIDQWGNIIYIYEISERAYRSFGFNAVIGTDIYIIKHLYLGFELGLGYTNYKYKEIEVKVDGALDEKYPESKETKTGLNVNNAIRLGFWF